MTVIDDERTESKKGGRKKSKDDEDFTDLDLDLELDDDDLSTDFSELEDIDLDEDVTEVNDVTDITDVKDENEVNEVQESKKSVRSMDSMELDDDLLKNTKDLFKRLKNISTDSIGKREGGKEKKAEADSSIDESSLLKVDEKTKRECLTKLSLIELKLEELGNLGLDVNIVKELIAESKKFIDENDFNSAKSLIHNSENLSSGIFVEHRMNVISTLISFIETFIFELTELELDFKYAEAYFNQAKSSLEDKDLTAANRYLKDTVQNVRKILNNSRKEKIEEAIKFFKFLLDELSENEIDDKKLKSIFSDTKNSFDADDIDSTEQYLKKLIYSSKAEVTKLELSIDKKEDYYQQFDGLYNFEDFSSLSDAISRAQTMLNESQEKELSQTNLEDLITSYHKIIRTQGIDSKLDITKVMTQFSEAKEAFEKEDYRTMETILSQLNPIISKEEPEKVEPELSEEAETKKIDTKDLVKSKEELDLGKTEELEELKDLEELEDLEGLEELEDLEDEPVIELEPETELEPTPKPEPEIDPKELMKINTEVSKLEKEIVSLGELGFDTTEHNNRIEDLKKVITDKDLDSSRQLIKELKKNIKIMKDEKAQGEEQKINKQIEDLASAIETAQKDGIKTNVAEDLLNYAKQRLKSKKYEDVNEIINHAHDMLNKSIKETKKFEYTEEAVNFIEECTNFKDTLPPTHPNLDELQEILENARTEFDNKNYEETLKLKKNFNNILKEIELKEIQDIKEIQEKSEAVEEREGIKGTAGTKEFEILDDSVPDKKDYFDEFKEFELEDDLDGDLVKDIESEEKYLEDLTLDDEVESDDDANDLEDLALDVKDEPEQEEEEDLEQDMEGLEAEEIEIFEDTATNIQSGKVPKESKPPEMVNGIEEIKELEKDIVKSEFEIEQTDTEIKLELEERVDSDIKIESQIEHTTEPDEEATKTSSVELDEPEEIPGEAEVEPQDMTVEEDFDEVLDTVSEANMQETLESESDVDDNVNLEPLPDKDTIIETEPTKVEELTNDQPVEPILKDESKLLGMPDTNELLKEAFGFKLSRDKDRKSGKTTKTKPQDIKQIKNKVLAKIENKGAPPKRQRPLFPHEIRELNRKTEPLPNNFEPADDYPKQPDQVDEQHISVSDKFLATEYIEKDSARSTRYQNGQSSMKNGSGYPDMKSEQYRDRRVIIDHPSRPQTQRRRYNLNAAGPTIPESDLRSIDGIEQIETQQQYETRINSLKKDALRGLQEIQSLISDTYYFGANIEELERISEDSRNAFDDRDYQEVLLYVDKVEELSRQLKLSYMDSLIVEFKRAGENSEYLEYLFKEIEAAYNEEKYKLGDELARRFINVIKDLESEEKIATQTWRYCRYCGNAIRGDSSFCSHCGEKLM